MLRARFVVSRISPVCLFLQEFLRGPARDIDKCNVLNPVLGGLVYTYLELSCAVAYIVFYMQARYSKDTSY